MVEYFMLVPIMLPILCGLFMLIRPIKDRHQRNVFVEGMTVLNSFFVLCCLIYFNNQTLTVFKFFNNIGLAFRIDGLGLLFSCLICFLWPLATLYAFEYMLHEKRENTFFAFYLATFGVTVGVAFSGNLLTMYVFYELLSLVTLPLVMHTMTPDALRAGRKYMMYSIGGAGFAFLSLIFVLTYSSEFTFSYGGTIPAGAFANTNEMLLLYVIGFFGFGVKAAVFPLHKWLPAASVAPVPVTALLHAVAVVKAGIFAIVRLTYYCFGTELLKGTWAQTVVMVAAMITVIYGSTMGVKEVHFKRRLAYSTVSNLSYILVGVTCMTPVGLVAGLCHMVFHAIAKICAFFVSGAFMYQTNRHHIYELDGIGRKMPVTFLCFAAASCSLVGVPTFAGFVSKWKLGEAAFSNPGWLPLIVVAVLLYAALMSAIYMLTVVVRAFFPHKGYKREYLLYVKEANWKMTVPMVIFAVMLIYFGLHSGRFVEFVTKLAAGLQ